VWEETTTLFALTKPDSAAFKVITQPVVGGWCDYGEGVPAALIMTMTGNVGEVLNDHSPALILQKLNRVMYADLETSTAL